MSARNADDAWEMECFIREKLITHIRENYPECLPRVRLDLSKDKDPG